MTLDLKTGRYNAGVSIMIYLDQWWNMKSYVQPVGRVKSGDQDVMNVLLKDIHEFSERGHAVAPAQECTLNSYLDGSSLEAHFRRKGRLLFVGYDVSRG